MTSRDPKTKPAEPDDSIATLVRPGRTAFAETIAAGSVSEPRAVDPNLGSVRELASMRAILFDVLVGRAVEALKAAGTQFAQAWRLRQLLPDLQSSQGPR